MHGHQPIIAMRKKRKKPSVVFLNDFPCKTDWFENGDPATVCVASDLINGLDLRFLVGLRVSIASDSESRAKALLGACVKAKAALVVANHVQADKKWWEKQTGWCEMVVNND